MPNPFGYLQVNTGVTCNVSIDEKEKKLKDKIPELKLPENERDYSYYTAKNDKGWADMNQIPMFKIAEKLLDVVRSENYTVDEILDRIDCVISRLAEKTFIKSNLINSYNCKSSKDAIKAYNRTLKLAQEMNVPKDVVERYTNEQQKVIDELKQKEREQIEEQNNEQNAKAKNRKQETSLRKIGIIV